MSTGQATQADAVASNAEGTQPGATASNADGGTQPGGNGSSKAAKTFTQEDVDRIVKTRAEKMARQMASQQAQEQLTALLEEHGLTAEQLEELKSKPEAMERSHKSVLGKMQKQLEEANAQIAKYRERDTKASIDAAISREAAAQTNDLETVQLHLSRRLRVNDENEVYVSDEKGNPTKQTVKDLVSELLAAKPHLALPQGIPGAGSRIALDASRVLPSGEPDYSKVSFDSAEARAYRIGELRKAFGG